MAGTGEPPEWSKCALRAEDSLGPSPSANLADRQRLRNVGFGSAKPAPPVRSLIGGESVINECRLRRELNTLRVGVGSPMMKARSFVRYARRVEDGQARLISLSAAFFRAGDESKGAFFLEAARRLLRMGREARNCARVALHARPLAYGYDQRQRPAASWTLNDLRLTSTGEGRS